VFLSRKLDQNARKTALFFEKKINKTKQNLKKSPQHWELIFQTSVDLRQLHGDLSQTTFLLTLYTVTTLLILYTVL